MNTRRHLGWSLALVAFALSWGVALWAVGETPGREYGSGSIHRSFEWREARGTGRASGLYLMDMVPAGMVSRVLVEGPAGRRIRITNALDPRRGLETCELLDDATGWRARLDLDFGYQADGLGAFFAADEARSAAAQHVPFRLRFAADGTPPVEVEVAAEERAVLHAAAAEAALSAGAGKELAARLPPGLAEAVLFLDSSMSPHPLQAHNEGDNFAHGLRGVVEILADIVRAAPPEGLEVERYATPWPMTVRPMERGTSSSDPTVLEFISRFRSVQNSDPLSDRLAAEVFADPPPPT